MSDLLHGTEVTFSRDEYRMLLEVAEAISVHRDLNKLFDDLARRLPAVVPLDYINLVLYDSVQHLMRLHILVAPDPTTIQPGMAFPVDASPGGLVWKTQQTLVVEDVALEHRFPTLTPLLLENGIVSFCVVPLTTALRRLGAMGFGSQQKRIYSGAELAFMQQVARQVAVAVDNVLHEDSALAAQWQLRAERDHVQLLLEVNNAVVSHLDLAHLFPAVSACLRKVLQHDGSALVLFDEATQRFRVHILQFADNRSVIDEGHAASDCCANSPAGIARKPVVCGEEDLVNLCSVSPLAQQLVADGIKAFCAVPLLAHDRVLGALNVARRRADLFQPEEV
jgi:formate hydrogenlyase transcriptional activator